MTHILSMGADKLMMDNTLLRLDAPRVIVGDIHGNLRALLHIFDTHGYPPDTRYLFLGDYVDRGPHGVECMCLLLAYKVLFPDAVHLLRGNHETGISEMYGFYDECVAKLNMYENFTTKLPCTTLGTGLARTGTNTGTPRYNKRMWIDFLCVFNRMPYAALLGDVMLCMHGGLSPTSPRLRTASTCRAPRRFLIVGCLLM